MRKIFTQVLPCGILPALNQCISRASKLGIFENPYCLPRDAPETLLDFTEFEVLSQILPMLTDQNFFQTLTTRMVESVMLGMAQGLFMRYVCICI